MTLRDSPHYVIVNGYSLFSLFDQFYKNNLNFKLKTSSTPKISQFKLLSVIKLSIYRNLHI